MVPSRTDQMTKRKKKEGKIEKRGSHIGKK